MRNVFISYSNKDRAFVERLARDLDAQGLDVFYDQRIQPGESWAESLSRAIGRAEFLLVVLSPDSVASPWVLQETSIGLAREAEGQAQVIPLLLAPCDIPAALAAKTYASFDADYAAGLQRVLAVLKQQPGDGLQPVAATGAALQRIRTDVAQFMTATAQPAAPRGAPLPHGGRLRCFIVMPFGDEALQVVYEDFIKPVLETQCGLDVERGDDVFGSNVIMDDIRTSIGAADLVLADLTGKNANVFYEVGICHALEKPVLLLAQSMDDVPFDLRHRRVLLYTYTPRGCKRLEKALPEQVRSITANLAQAPG